MLIKVHLEFSRSLHSFPPSTHFFQNYVLPPKTHFLFFFLFFKFFINKLVFAHASRSAYQFLPFFFSLLLPHFFNTTSPLFSSSAWGGRRKSSSRKCDNLRQIFRELQYRRSLRGVGRSLGWLFSLSAFLTLFFFFFFSSFFSHFLIFSSSTRGYFCRENDSKPFRVFLSNHFGFFGIFNEV